MYEFILIIHVLVTLALVTLILIQQGKGAEIGAAFGSGASNTVFGSSGSASFLSRTTAILATLFFATSLSLSYIASRQLHQQDKLDIPVVSQPVTSDVPAVSNTDTDVPAVTDEANNN